MPGPGAELTQTYAFSAWIFAHIALAHVSRSDKQTIAATGMFSNIVINIWSILAIGVLMAAIYLPVVSRQFNLTMVPLITVLEIAAAVTLLISTLEMRKLAKRA